MLLGAPSPAASQYASSAALALARSFAFARSSLAALATVALLFSAFFLAIVRRSRLVLACGCGRRSKTGEDWF